MTLFKNYYVRLLLFSAAVFVLATMLARVPNRYFESPHVYIITSFFFATTVLANLAFTKSDTKSRDFIMKIMAVSAGRLLFSMITIFVYSRVAHGHALGFAVHFMLQYVLFTIFELSYILKFIRQ
ncbi:MAG: hypothetical protein JST26_10870 [Bacteroidetes bacterium]|nr:hypothetical protein [Bacteroidota bacterium]